MALTAGLALLAVMSVADSFGWCREAKAMEMDYTSTVVLSTASSGEPMLRIEVRTGDRLFRGTIWGKGLAALAAGQLSLELDNRPGADGTGRGEICEKVGGAGSKTACVQVERMTLRFERIELRAGGKIYGYMSLQHKGSPLEYPFGGSVEGN